MPINPRPNASVSAFVTLTGVAARTPDGSTLFDNLTLAFGAERTGVVGRNGVGKSTLLRLISGASSPVLSAPKARVRVSKSVEPSGVRAATPVSVTNADTDALGLGLIGMEDRKQHGGKGETSSQRADHDRLASKLKRGPEVNDGS